MRHIINIHHIDDMTHNFMCHIIDVISSIYIFMCHIIDYIICSCIISLYQIASHHIADPWLVRATVTKSDKRSCDIT